MNKLGIPIVIPGFGSLEIRAIVSDYTGTCAFGGKLRPGVVRRLRLLKELVDIHIVSSDSFGTASGQLAQVPLRPYILKGENAAQQKTRYLEENVKIDKSNIAAFGNGMNDVQMLKAVKQAKGLATVDNGEGCAIEAMQNSNLFIIGITNALDLLLEPTRCKATLRD